MFTSYHIRKNEVTLYRKHIDVCNLYLCCFQCTKRGADKKNTQQKKDYTNIYIHNGVNLLQWNNRIIIHHFCLALGLGRVLLRHKVWSAEGEAPWDARLSTFAKGAQLVLFIWSYFQGPARPNRWSREFFDPMCLYKGLNFHDTIVRGSLPRYLT